MNILQKNKKTKKRLYNDQLWDLVLHKQLVHLNYYSFLEFSLYSLI